MTTSRLTALLTICTATIALADHGPGTSGSGVNTETAETLKARQWSSTLKFDWTEFDPPSDAFAVGKDHFDFIDRSFLTTLSVSFGVTENFQLSLTFGYYAAEGTRQIAHGHGETESHEEGARERAKQVRRIAHGPGSHDGHEEEVTEGTGHSEPPSPSEHEHEHEAGEETAAPEAPQIDSFDPDGWTDLWLTAKYRLYRGPLGQFALFGGVKFPVGEDRVFTSSGERVEPASTPGSGAWDGLFGAAYTQALGPSVAVDASVQYIVRGEAHDYRLGNRFDAGGALGWRFIGSAQSYPQASLQAEATVRSVAKSEEAGEREENTGGTVLFLSPGLRVRFTERAALSASVHFPVVQDLNGDQVETDFRVTGSFTFSF